MVADTPSALLAAAGTIGLAVAVAHALILQRVIVHPLDKAVEEHGLLKGAARRLLTPLLHVSSLDWFVAGAALLVAAFSEDRGLRLGVCLVAVPIYIFAAVVNFRATRGRHIGWLAMALASLLAASALVLEAGYNGSGQVARPSVPLTHAGPE